LAVVNRISTELAKPIWYLGQQVGVTASVGVAFWRTGDEADVAELVRRADATMYSVKRNGRNAFAVFDAANEPITASTGVVVQAFPLLAQVAACDGCRRCGIPEPARRLVG